MVGMEHVRTGVQRRTLIGAGAAVLAFGGVLGAFVASDDDSGRREISEVSDTTTSEAPTTTEPTSTTVEVTTTAAPATTAAPVVTAAPTSPQPIEQKVAEHEERISDLEAEVAPPPSTPTTAAPEDPCALLPQGSDARATCESG